MKCSKAFFLSATGSVMATPMSIAHSNGEANQTSDCTPTDARFTAPSTHHLGEVLKNIAGSDIKSDYGKSTMLGCSDDTAVWLTVAALGNGQQGSDGGFHIAGQDVANYVKNTYTYCYNVDCCDLKDPLRDQVPNFKYIGTTPSAFNFNLTIEGDKNCSKEQM